MRDLIISTAVKLFVKFGYKSVTMDDIANQMCISKKTLYKSYRSKEKLVEEAACSVKDDLFIKIKDILTWNYDPVRENLEIQKLIIGIYKYIPPASRFELMKYYPETYFKEIIKQHPKLIGYLRQNIEKGIVMGFYLSDLDATYCAKLTFMLLTASVDNLKSDYGFSQYPEKIIAYNIRAIATEKGREALIFAEILSG
ncbi:TetR/AcrR family transcriptional regulator [Flavobacterium ginsenosidimutans]|uniref:TetR/AcrR family transcriptional regulator n=1 Tax=Flavobacterium ginsenosidimutans TaxID=687844 RepID=UPI003D99A392